MTTETTLSDDQIQLLKAWATVVKDNNTGETYYHLPQWFKDLGKGEFEIVYANDLPDWAKELSEPNESIKKADAYLDNVEQLFCQGEVYSDSGYYYKDVQKAIRIAAGLE